MFAALDAVASRTPIRTSHENFDCVSSVFCHVFFCRPGGNHLIEGDRPPEKQHQNTKDALFYNDPNTEPFLLNYFAQRRPITWAHTIITSPISW